MPNRCSTDAPEQFSLSWYLFHSLTRDRVNSTDVLLVIVDGDVEYAFFDAIP